MSYKEIDLRVGDPAATGRVADAAVAVGAPLVSVSLGGAFRGEECGDGAHAGALFTVPDAASLTALVSDVGGACAEDDHQRQWWLSGHVWRPLLSEEEIEQCRPREGGLAPRCYAERCCYRPHRKKFAWRALCVAMADIDRSGERNHIDEAALRELIRLASASCGYLTSSGARLLWLLSRPVTTAADAQRIQYGAAEIADGVLSQLGLRAHHFADHAVVDLTRVMYGAGTWRKGKPRAPLYVLPGTADSTPPEVFLAQAGDWQPGADLGGIAGSGALPALDADVIIARARHRRDAGQSRWFGRTTSPAVTPRLLPILIELSSDERAKTVNLVHGSVPSWGIFRALRTGEWPAGWRGGNPTHVHVVATIGAMLGEDLMIELWPDLVEGFAGLHASVEGKADGTWSDCERAMSDLLEVGGRLALSAREYEPHLGKVEWRGVIADAERRLESGNLWRDTAPGAKELGRCILHLPEARPVLWPDRRSDADLPRLIGLLLRRARDARAEVTGDAVARLFAPYVCVHRGEYVDGRLPASKNDSRRGGA